MPTMLFSLATNMIHIPTEHIDKSKKQNMYLNHNNRPGRNIIIARRDSLSLISLCQSSSQNFHQTLVERYMYTCVLVSLRFYCH